MTYPGSLAGMAETIADPTGMGPLMLSQLGVDGAFESAGVSGVGNLIGSPGVPVPEPTTAALAFCGILGLAGLAARRR